LEFKLLEFLKRSSSDNSADERDRQLMQHERPADLFDEDCGFNTPSAAVALSDPNRKVFDVCS
jgi:hypothetical protein